MDNWRRINVAMTRVYINNIYIMYKIKILKFKFKFKIKVKIKINYIGKYITFENLLEYVKNY